MKSTFKCIYSYYETLLGVWNDWNDGILYGKFPQGANNFTEALGIHTSDGRSRAKELYRIGLLKKELTKGTSGLDHISQGHNIQSDLGYISALISKAASINRTNTIDKALSSLCSIYSIIQSVKIDKLEFSINTLIQRLDEDFPCPETLDFRKWHRYVLSAFFCETKYREVTHVNKEEQDNDSKIFINFITGQESCPPMTIRLNEKQGYGPRKTIANTQDVLDAISEKVSLTDIIQQKSPLFMFGDDREKNPKGFYGMALKYNKSFLRLCYELEKSNFNSSPFINLYDEDKSDSAKGNVLTTLKEIFDNQEDKFKNEFYTIMKSIYEGALEALEILNYRPKQQTTFQLVNDSINYIAALRTKPFLLLAGISGTGKSQKVQELAYMTCPKGDLRNDGGTTPGNYCLIEVKPNWHDSTELLGYYSALLGKYELTDFIRFVYKAQMNSDIPFFLCLDEMNLAPVEQYFAEFLSVLETRKKTVDGIKSQPLLSKERFSKCKLHEFILTKEEGVVKKDNQEFNMRELYSEKDAEIIEYLKQNGLYLPDNLFVIGTVNMDDTTHQFSRKVIDRAFTIEMNGGKMSDMFSDESKHILEYRENPIPLSAFKSKFVRAYEVLDDPYFMKYKDVICSKVPNLLGDSDGMAVNDSINGILNNTPFRVSYRVQNELVLYLSILIENADFPDDIDNLISEATLTILLEKVLPRVQGEQKQLETKGGKSNILKDLKLFVEQHFTPTLDDNEDIQHNCLYEKVLKKLDEMDSKLTGYYTNFF